MTGDRRKCREPSWPGEADFIARHDARGPGRGDAVVPSDGVDIKASAGAVRVPVITRTLPVSTSVPPLANDFSTSDAGK